MGAEGLEGYVEGHRRRAAARRAALARRREAARAAAEAMARALADEFGAREVRLFGSVLDPDAFDERSDIDLAARGIPPERFLAALGRLERLAAGAFGVDLVDLDACASSLRAWILERGVVLVDRG